ncbi:Guanine nucleotide-binding protein subunit alpha-13, partial [Frankliniella fusca]
PCNLEDPELSFECVEPSIKIFKADVPYSDNFQSNRFPLSPSGTEDETPTEAAEDFPQEYFWTDKDDTVTQTPLLGPFNEPTFNYDEDCEVEENKEDGCTTPVVGETVLYPGATISVFESVTSVLSYVASEHISGVGLTRLLTLIDLHLPQPNNFPKTNHRLFKTLEEVDDPVHMHFFCNVCYKMRLSKTDLCNSCTDNNRYVDYFLTFPVVPQLKKKFQRPDFMQHLQYKTTRSKINENNIEDVFDGQVYKGAETRMMNENGITFTLNTDGIQIFKSNTYSLWPIYLVINEVPPEKRYLSENLIIAGLWGSLLKPHPNVYLLPIYKELAALKIGVQIPVYGEQEPVQIVAETICATCDAPATSLFMNMKSHSGFYSCPVCLTKGSKPGDATVFPYEENAPLRNLPQYKENVKLAVEKK